MTATNPLTELLRPHVAELIRSSAAGNKKARDVITWYEMHRKCPHDPGAPVVCEAAFKDWMKSQHPKKGPPQP